MIGEIGIVTIRVDRWPEMLEFYRDRLGLRPVVLDERNEYAMFDTGAVRLALEGPVRPAVPRAPGASAAVVNFRTDDIHRTVEELRQKHVVIHGEPREGPGYVFVGFTDPEGNDQIVYQRVKRP